MSVRHPLTISHLVRFEMNADGSKYAFQIDTKQGVSIDLELAAERLGPIVQFLVANAAATGHQLYEQTHVHKEQAENLAAIPTEAFGLVPGPTPDKMLLLVRLYGFDLGFEIPTAMLAEFGDRISRTAEEIPGNPAKPN
ncbi:MAG: hypothetical protein ACREHF_11570 [Rhizomicrobium sp.]